MKKQTILVTGAAGLLGANFCKYLCDKSYDVIGVDNLSGGYREFVDPRVEFYNCELTWHPEIDFVFREADRKIDYIYHFAAYAACGLSPFVRRFNYNNNIIASANLINKAINENVKKFIFASCHDSRTRLATKDGLKYYDQINMDDIVYSIDKAGKVVETKINHIKVFDYHGSMVSLYGRRINALVTPNHRILSRTSTGNIKYITADKILDRSTLTIPIGKVSKSVKTDDIFTFDESDFHWNTKQPRQILKSDLFYLFGLYISDGSISTKNKKLKTGLSAKEYKTNRDAKGRFVKSSCVQSGLKKYVTSSNKITFCVPQEDKARGPLLDVLERNNIKWFETRVNKNAGYTYISINHKPLVRLFKSCGRTAKEKHIPNWVFYDTSTACLNALFAGLMDGDGDKHRRTYTTVSPKLKDQIVALVFKLGMCASVSVHKPRKAILVNESRLINSKHKVYSVYISQTDISLTKKNITKKNIYVGKVWCLEVPHGNFLVERSGKYHFSGNSMTVYGDQTPPFTEEMGYKPSDPYAIAKMAVELDLKDAYERHGLNYAVVRPHNVHGIYQNIWDRYRNVIGIFIRRALNGEDLLVYGDGKQVRAFSDVKYYMKPMEKLIKEHPGETFNIGADKPTTILELAEIVQKVAFEDGKSVKIKHKEPRNEVKVAYCDHTKAKKLLGFEDQTKLEELIKEMYFWAKEQPNRKVKKMKKEVKKGLYSYWK